MRMYFPRKDEPCVRSGIRMREVCLQCAATLAMLLVGGGHLTSPPPPPVIRGSAAPLPLNKLSSASIAALQSGRLSHQRSLFRLPIKAFASQTLLWMQSSGCAKYIFSAPPPGFSVFANGILLRRYGCENISFQKGGGGSGWGGVLPTKVLSVKCCISEDHFLRTAWS